MVAPGGGVPDGGYLRGIPSNSSIILANGYIQAVKKGLSLIKAVKAFYFYFMFFSSNNVSTLVPEWIIPNKTILPKIPIPCWIPSILVFDL